jgi:putative ABC transport system permease protein
MTHRLIAHSLRTVLRHKLRSAFMMLGSFVGVAVLALVVSIGEGADRKMQSTVKQLFGASSIVVVAGGGRFMGGPRPDGPRLTLDDLEAVAAEVPAVDAWDPQQAMPEAQVRSGEAVATARVVGQSERSERVWDRGVTAGEYFDAAAVAGSARVALVGTTVARDLFGAADPVGGEIFISAVPFRVIGVLEPLGSDAHGMDRDDEIIVPISTAQRRLMNVDTIMSAKLLVKDASQVEEAAKEVRRVLRERHALGAGQADDFTLHTPAQVRRVMATVRRVFFVFLPLVAGIALLVGGVVAATIMLSSVNERVGEIGIRRAVGAETRDIVAQFLLETAVTMLGGGLLGLVAGSAVAQLIANRMSLGPVISWKAVLLGVVLSVGTGLLAGVLPARRAARLQPVEALR